MTDVQQMAAIIQNAAEFTPYWTDDPATHQDPYENAAKALIEAGYGKLVDEYEYAIQYFDHKDKKWYVMGEWYGYGLMDFWTDIEDREQYLDELRLYYVETTFMLVKRRTAGGIEDV
jgi:hypothetical protein